ncbi:MAG TPA: hypothetical protein VGI83_01885 [Gemmatimonadales bacterium]|jgi:hypothetical protein
MKRVFMLIAATSALMLADVIGLLAATQAFRPNKPPLWLTGIFYWPLAWPVPVFAKVFNGPSFIAVLLSGLLDFGLLYALLSFLERRWRRRQGARAA